MSTRRSLELERELWRIRETFHMETKEELPFSPQTASSSSSTASSSSSLASCGASTTSQMNGHAGGDEHNTTGMINTMHWSQRLLWSEKDAVWYPLHVHINGLEMLVLHVDPFIVSLHSLLSLLTRWNLVRAPPSQLHVVYEKKYINLTYLTSLSDDDEMDGPMKGEDEAAWRDRMSRIWHQPLSCCVSPPMHQHQPNHMTNNDKGINGIGQSQHESSSRNTSVKQQTDQKSAMKGMKNRPWSNRVSVDMPGDHATSHTSSRPSLHLHITHDDVHSSQNIKASLGFSQKVSFRMYPKFSANDSFVAAYILSVSPGDTPKEKHLRGLWQRLRFLLRDITPDQFAEHLWQQHSVSHEPSIKTYTGDVLKPPTTKGALLSMMIRATTTMTPEMVHSFMEEERRQHRSIYDPEAAEHIEGSSTNYTSMVTKLKATVIQDLPSFHTPISATTTATTTPNSSTRSLSLPKTRGMGLTPLVTKRKSVAVSSTGTLPPTAASDASHMGEMAGWLWLMLLRMANTFVDTRMHARRVNSFHIDDAIGLQSCCRLADGVPGLGVDPTGKEAPLTSRAVTHFFDQLWLSFGDIAKRPIRTWSAGMNGEQDPLSFMHLWCHELLSIALDRKAIDASSRANNHSNKSFPAYVTYWANHALYTAFVNHTFTHVYRQQRLACNAQAVETANFVPFSVTGYQDLDPNVHRFRGVYLGPIGENAARETPIDVSPGKEGQYLFSIQSLCFHNGKMQCTSPLYPPESPVTHLPMSSNTTGSFGPMGKPQLRDIGIPSPLTLSSNVSSLFSIEMFKECMEHWLYAGLHSEAMPGRASSLQVMLQELGSYMMLLFFEPGQNDRFDAAIGVAMGSALQVHDKLTQLAQEAEAVALTARRRRSSFFPQSNSRQKTKDEYLSLAREYRLELACYEKVCYCAFDLYVQRLRIDLFPTAGLAKHCTSKMIQEKIVAVRERILAVQNEFRRACNGQGLMHPVPPSISSHGDLGEVWNDITRDIMLAWKSEEQLECPGGLSLMRTLQTRLERVIEMMLQVSDRIVQTPMSIESANVDRNIHERPCAPLAVPFLTQTPQDSRPLSSTIPMISQGDDGSVYTATPVITQSFGPEGPTGHGDTVVVSPKNLMKKRHLAQLLDMALSGFRTSLASQQDALVVGIRRLLLECLGTPFISSRHLHLVRTPGAFIAFIYSRQSAAPFTGKVMQCGSKMVVPTALALVFSSIVPGYVRCIPYVPFDRETYPNLAGDQPAFERLLWHVHQMQSVHLGVLPEDFHVQWVDESVQGFYERFRGHLLSPNHQDILTPPLSLNSTPSPRRRPSQVFWPQEVGDEKETLGTNNFVTLPQNLLSETLEGLEIVMDSERAYHAIMGESMQPLVVRNPTVNQAIFFPVSSSRLRSSCSCG